MLGEFGGKYGSDELYWSTFEVKNNQLCMNTSGSFRETRCSDLIFSNDKKTFRMPNFNQKFNKI